jgi:hypothetical protein
MDINGAKELKRRIGERRSDEPRREPADIADHAPPIYHWLGVEHAATEGPQADDDHPASAGASLFRRLRLSFR